MYWRCKLREDWPVRIYTNIGSEEIVYRSQKLHNHAPNLVKILRRIATMEMENNGKQGNPNQQIIGEFTQNLDAYSLSTTSYNSTGRTTHIIFRRYYKII